MATKTIRVYVDGGQTPAATRVVDAADNAAPIMLYGLAPGAHAIETTVQVAGREESVRSAPKTVRPGAYYAPTPFAVEGATLAQTLSLRTILRNRMQASFGETFDAGPMYRNGVTFLNDYAYSMGAHRGYWTRQKVRAVADGFAATIGQYHDPITNNVVAAPPQTIKNDGTVGSWVSYGVGRFPDLSKAADLVALAIYCHDLGDPTAWTTYKPILEAALTAFPEVVAGGGKLHWSDPATDVMYDPVGDTYRTTYFWWDEDLLVVGQVGTAAVEFCRAYLEMKRVAAALGDTASAAAYQARVDAFVLGLRTLRLASGTYAGLYIPNTYQPGKGHIPMSVYIAALGLCSEAERTETLAKILSLYQAGSIIEPTYPMYFRSRPYPQEWVPEWEGNFAWGDYWSSTGTVPLLARCLELAGRSDLATQCMQNATRELCRQHRVNGLAPRETVVSYGAAPSGGSLQTFASCWVSDLAEALPESVDLTLSGAPGSSVERTFLHGHTIHGVSVTAPGAASVTVRLSGSNLLPATGTNPGSDGTWTTMADVALSGLTARVDGPRPIGAFGGIVKASVLSGSYAGTLTVRLHMRPPGVPKLTATETPGPCWIPPGFVAEAGLGSNGYGTAWIQDELPTDGVTRTVILRSVDGSEVSRATGAYFAVNYV